MGRTPRSWLVALVAALLTAATLAARPPQETQQPPVFRGATETVAIYATVIDRYGEMVRDLDRDDFIVEDEGRRQDLTVFVNDFQPITAAVLVDTSASMTLNLELARTAAEQFVIRMLPGDRVRVGSFSDQVELSASFTDNRDELLRTMRDSFEFGNPTRLWDAVGEAMTELAPLGGRRILVLMTDGFDTMSKSTADEILARAREDELMIYVVQFRSTRRAQLAEMPLAPAGGAAFADPAKFTAPTIDALRRLASATGGGHFVLGQYDDVNATFTQVMLELHYQYVLGFAPQRLDGRVHDLTVRTTDKEHTVRARQSYRAPRADTSPR